jgi:hypothetical protein
MNVLIITKDEVFSRMLFLEISAFGAQAHEARELSEETKREIPLCDFTVLDAALFAEEEEELSELESNKLIAIGSRDDLAVQAKTLFTALRDADKLGAEVIYGHLPPKHGLGLALYN